MAGLAGRASSTRGTYRSALYRLAEAVHGPPGQRATPFAGARRRRRTRRRSGRSWPLSRLPSATRRNGPRRWRWWCSASGRGCGPASWWRCAAMTSPGTAARSWCMSAGRPRGWCRSPRITPAGRPSWPAARAAVSCSAPARPTAATRTSSATSPGAWPLTRPRRGCRCAGPGPAFICDHLAAGTPVPVLLAITGIAEAGSLARYARHVSGISSSKGALRARWRAERTR